MNRIMLVASLTLFVLVLACGGKQEPVPQPQPQVQQPAPEPEPEPEPEPAVDTTAKQEVEPEPEEAEETFRSVPGEYTIQVASWATKEDAAELAEFYNDKGYDARVESADLDSGRWYRVRIGHYKNSGDAHEVAQEIAENYKSDIWLVRL